MMLRKFVMALCVAVVTFSLIEIASAGYFVNLSALAGYYQTCPCAVSSGGAVSLQGASSASGGLFHTYLYTGGTAATMNNITSTFNPDTAATSMNASGQMAIMGLFAPVSGDLYSGGLGGTVTTYQIGASNTFSMGINSHGDEGGYYINTSNSVAPWYPYVDIGGTTYALNQPASDEPYYTAWGAGITALNTNGQAVGFSTPGNPEDMNAAVWTYTVSGGSVTSQTATNIQALVHSQYPTALSSELVAINNSGDAVGQWSTSYVPGILLSAVNGSFIYNVGSSTFTSLGDLLVGGAEKPSSTHGAGMSWSHQRFRGSGRLHRQQR